MTLRVRQVVLIPNLDPSSGKGARPAVVLEVRQQKGVVLVFAGTTTPAASTGAESVQGGSRDAQSMGLSRTTHFQWPRDVRVVLIQDVEVYKPPCACPVRLFLRLKKLAEELAPHVATQATAVTDEGDHPVAAK